MKKFPSLLQSYGHANKENFDSFVSDDADWGYRAYHGHAFF